MYMNTYFPVLVPLSFLYLKLSASFSGESSINNRSSIVGSIFRDVNFTNGRFFPTQSFVTDMVTSRYF